MKILFSLCLIIWSVVALSQQAPSIKFGKISSSDLEVKSYAIDTTATAIVLSDIGYTQIKGNKKGWFSLEFKRHTRIHILNKSAYDFATVAIPLYTDGESEEVLSDIKAVAYNHENGKIVESPISKEEIFKDKKNKNTVITKFTLPNVKEGTIIEYEYKVISDFLFNLRSWEFQGSIPRLYSEYKVGLPQFLNYTLISQGSQNFYIQDEVNKMVDYTVTQKREASLYGADRHEVFRITCGLTNFRWAMKDMPAMNEEAYTTTLDNYVAKLEFQLSGYQDPLIPEKIMMTWPDAAKKMLEREDFGQQITKDNFWLDNVMKPLLKNNQTALEKAQIIYTYVRDNINCTSHSQLYPEQTIKNVLKNRNGGVAEINLLLTAMFRYAGLVADPLILSTRDNGFIHPRYPLINRFNYVVVRLKIDETSYFADASYAHLGFGQLSNNCFNGAAILLNDEGTSINLSPDLVTEIEETTVTLMNDASGKWKGEVITIFGDAESIEARKHLAAKGRDTYLKEISDKLSSEIKVDEFIVDSLYKYDAPVKAAYKIHFDKFSEDVLYISPVLTGSIKQNPFKSAVRQYPVEMPYKLNDIYKISMAVPAGYFIEELPASLSIKLSGNEDALFDYSIKRVNENIILSVKLLVNKTTFYSNEYNGLRDFFGKVVAKMNEQIVFKKKQ